ncbi:adenosylcobinamide-GDP ribazoletransferase [Neotabrizicola sp. VNH66]|uniref:adenosylcobinamide-GDP ribazoletransferase n=1 Tax=Neotabrizicola sp. VNH66 TaxID=3400918 RepID=UPI003C002B02
MKTDLAARLRDDLCSALSLLTRLPVPAHAFRGAAGAWAWALVGALVGGFGAAAGALAAWAGAGPGPAAAAALAAMALTTGGLHEDGLADTADGLLGGRDRDRRLEIMKDSRIGSYGALALMLVTLAQWSALAAASAPALIAAAALSRAPMAAVMAALPPARATGLSAGTGRPTAGTALAACALALLIALALCGTKALVAAAAILVLTTLLARVAQSRIGGQTGDILGASQQIAMAAALPLLA